jgi:CDP-glycerol glycerophosphotransferase (TagB/SpsB family)
MKKELKKEVIILKIFRELIRCLFDSSLVLLSYLFPKDSNLYVFASHDGSMFKGNPRYLFKYFQRYKEVIWITNNYSLKLLLEESDSFVAYTYSLKGFWSALRAKYIFVDNGLRGPFASGVLIFLGRFKIIQTWHGTGFKNIALMDCNFKGLHRIFIRAVCMSFNTVLASAECDKIQFKKSFKNENVIVTGSPRNDVFFNSDLLWRDYKTELGLSYFKKVVVYAPTYRENQNFKPFDIVFLRSLDRWLRESNNVLLIKKHPSDKSLRIDSSLTNILDVTGKVEDVQELLVCTDILITDYSSIATDFILTSRPMIFYVYDYEDYPKNRTLYRDMKDSLPGPFAYNQLELFSLLRDLSWFENPCYKEKYSKIRDMFHAYKDGKSCERVEKMLSDKEFK